MDNTATYYTTLFCIVLNLIYLCVIKVIKQNTGYQKQKL